MDRREAQRNPQTPQIDPLDVLSGSVLRIDLGDGRIVRAARHDEYNDRRDHRNRETSEESPTNVVHDDLIGGDNRTLHTSVALLREPVQPTGSLANRKTTPSLPRELGRPWGYRVSRRATALASGCLDLAFERLGTAADTARVTSGADPFGNFYEQASSGSAPVGSAERGPRRRGWMLVAIGVGAAGTAAAAVVLTSSGTPTPTTPAAIARAINVRQSDLPGYTVEPNANATVGGQPQQRFNRCVGFGTTLLAYLRNGSDLAAGATISSPQFTDGSGLQSESVSSTVAIEGSRTVVARELAEARSQLARQRVENCLDQALDNVTYHYPTGVSIALSDVAVSPVPSPAGGTDGNVAIEVEMTLTASTGITVPIYMDMFGFGVGRDALSLLTLSIQHPFPFTTDTQLASLMVNRATQLPH
jgi:hypothetical protein